MVLATTLVISAALGTLAWNLATHDDAASEVAAGATAGHPLLSPPPFSVDDVLGDAYDGGAERLTIGPGCHFGCISIPQAAENEAVQAPWLDVTQASFVEESADTVRLAVTIADMPADMSMLDPGAALARFAMYGVCWRPTIDSAQRCTSAHVSAHHGEVQAYGVYDLYSEACGNDVQSVTQGGRPAHCVWYTPMEMHPGTPGRVIFDVPKVYLTFDGAPLRIAELSGYSTTYSTNTAWPGWHQAATVAVAGENQHGHAGLFHAEDFVDVSPASDVAVELTPSDAPWPSTTGPLSVAEHGNIWGRGGIYDTPEFDLLAADLHEEGDETVVTYTVAGWPDEEPAYTYHFETFLGLAGQDKFEVGIRKDTVDAAPYAYVGQCIALRCHDSWKERSDTVQIEPGAPATLQVRFPTALLGDDIMGQPTTLFITIPMRSEASVMVGETGDDPHAEAHTMAEPDFHMGSWPYFFGSGHRAEDGHTDDHGHA